MQHFFQKKVVLQNQSGGLPGMAHPTIGTFDFVLTIVYSSVCTGFPSCPSEYASLAAQTVIGQVLEGVAPLSDDARIQALSITMTAFMEAWMEHILKQKIKFRYI